MEIFLVRFFTDNKMTHVLICRKITEFRRVTSDRLFLDDKCVVYDFEVGGLCRNVISD